MKNRLQNPDAMLRGIRTSNPRRSEESLLEAKAEHRRKSSCVKAPMKAKPRKKTGTNKKRDTSSQ